MSGTPGLEIAAWTYFVRPINKIFSKRTGEMNKVNPLFFMREYSIYTSYLPSGSYQAAAGRTEAISKSDGIISSISFFTSL